MNGVRTALVAIILVTILSTSFLFPFEQLENEKLLEGDFNTKFMDDFEIKS